MTYPTKAKSKLVKQFDKTLRTGSVGGARTALPGRLIREVSGRLPATGAGF